MGRPRLQALSLHRVRGLTACVARSRRTAVAPSDEHDEQGILISDEFTNPTIRKAMMEKRMRKVDGILRELPAPELQGPAEADVTLVGWGSTQGLIREAVALLAEEGITANHLQIKYLVPFHAAEVEAILQRSKCRSLSNTTSPASWPAIFVPRPASRWTRKFSNMTGNPLSPITSLSA